MRIRLILAGAIAVPLTLSACGGGDDSIADPPVSSAPTSSATPSSHRESAEHFIRRWTSLEKAMENSGKVRSYLAVSEKCKPCAKLAREVRGFYQAGGYVKWGGWSIESLERTDTNGPLVTYTVRIHSAPTVYRESSKGPLQHLDGGPSIELLTIRRSDSGWIMDNTAEQSS